MPAPSSVTLNETANLLASFSERVLRVKLEGCDLPLSLADMGRAEGGGWWRIPIADTAHVEDTLTKLRDGRVLAVGGFDQTTFATLATAVA